MSPHIDAASSPQEPTPLERIVRMGEKKVRMRMPGPDVRRSLLTLGTAVFCACSSGEATAPSVPPDEAPVIEPYIQYDTIVAGDTVALTITVSDDRRLHVVRAEWGDGSPDAAVTVNVARFTGSFRHAYSDRKRELVRFTATDFAGHETLAIGIVHVLPRNEPPVIRISCPDTVAVGARFEVAINVEDDDGLGVVLLDWGDGTPVRSFDSGAGCPSICYRVLARTELGRYRRMGRYVLTVEARDYPGLRTNESRTIEVIQWPE